MDNVAGAALLGLVLLAPFALRWVLMKRGASQDGHQHRGNTRAHAPWAAVTIDGPPPFRAAVERVLAELHAKAPHRYQEVLRYFPHVSYDPALLLLRAQGTSDGRFALDATTVEYERFRWILLHEVGHRVGRRPYQEARSEAAASEYANVVTQELS